MHLNGIPEAFLHTSCATIKAFLVYTSVLHTFSTRKRQQKNKDVIPGLGQSVSRKTLPEVLNERAFKTSGKVFLDTDLPPKK